MHTKTKVVYILTPIIFGGSEKVSLNFLKHVDRERFEIHPILLTRPWEDKSFFESELEALGYIYETVPVARQETGDPLRVLRVAVYLNRIINKTAYDLVHTHGYFADICALPIAWVKRLPRISTCHGFIATDRHLKLYNRIDKYALQLCQRVISVSPAIRDDLVQHGIRASRVAVIQNAVGQGYSEEERIHLRYVKRRILGIAPHEHAIGFVGRLSEEKGLPYLLDACADLKRHSNSFKLVIMGEGPLRAALEQQVQYLGLDYQVIFTGFMEHVEAWIAALDVFVLPSLTEGTPMALLEAMSMQVPILATAVGGVPRVVKHGMNGLLIQPADSRAIFEGLKILLGDHNLRTRLLKEALTTIASDYDVRRWCRIIEQQYLAILSNSQGVN